MGNAYTDDRPLHRASPRAGGLGLSALLWLLVLTGAAMRVTWPQETAFCNDQARACAMAQDIAAGHHQAGGLVNSGGFRNLPAYPYLLAGAWRIWPDPMGLMALTMILNLLALVGAYWLIRRGLGETPALWALAMLACAPWAIQYSRWIWAQDLLFPSALCVYGFAWLWLVRGREWAAGLLVLSLTLLVQIHLAGLAAALALAVTVAVFRPRIPWRFVLPAAALAIVSVVPYLLAHGLSSPSDGRTGYQHFWRVVPAAAMSVTGLGWQLEFKQGYGAFIDTLGWRHRPYQLLMLIGPILLVGAWLWHAPTLWRRPLRKLSAQGKTIAMLVLLTAMIPLAMMAMGIRTSPTYLPVWYPLPFALMGLTIHRLLQTLSRPAGRVLALALVTTLAGQLAFFGENLRYIHDNGGVPGSILGPHYASLSQQARQLLGQAEGGGELRYTLESPIQNEAIPYLMRLGDAKANSPFAMSVLIVPPTEVPDADETERFVIRPWQGPQQAEGHLRRTPAELDAGQ